MHTGALRRAALALTFWLALHATPLRATSLPLGPYGTSPITFEVDTNGLLSDTGTFGTGTLSFSGAGTRMLWFPGKAAFRAGTVNGTQWDTANVGQYSMAFGLDNTASGYASTASGLYSSASGEGSTAIGHGSATGFGSTAIGVYNNAVAPGAAAFGFNNTASGSYAATLGTYNTASGYVATALGAGNVASGKFSFVSGLYTTASAYLSFVTGTYNVGGGTATSWVATDPLFEIGNGTSSTHSDAFEVLKNGNATLKGTLSVTAGGDIPMYTGN